MLKEYEEKKNKILNIWNDRLLGCERKIEVWQTILSVR